MILKRIKIVLAIFIITSLIGSMLLLIGNFNKINSDNTNIKKLETKYNKF